MDLPFDARIAVRIGTGGKVARAAEEHRDMIAGEALASDFRNTFEDLGMTREFELAGEQVRVSVKPA